MFLFLVVIFRFTLSGSESARKTQKKILNSMSNGLLIKSGDRPGAVSTFSVAKVYLVLSLMPRATLLTKDVRSSKVPRFPSDFGLKRVNVKLHTAPKVISIIIKLLNF